MTSKMKVVVLRERMIIDNKITRDDYFDISDSGMLRQAKRESEVVMKNRSKVSYLPAKAK
ncbi:hypothetical protein [Klebsiella variicola]|uniref:hypothetical protein n=1 Tax=Klebsiella variicola TaxID=244366 RepID=UPI0037546547